MNTNFIQHPSISKDIDSQFAIAISQMKLVQDGEPVYGWNRKSVGCRVIDSERSTRWLRVQSRATTDTPGKLWYGLQDAEQLNVERKPHLLESVEWETIDRVWRAELMTFVPFKTCSATPDLKESIQLSPEWFNDLQNALSSFGDYETERVNTRQDLVTRRLQERFGDRVDPQVSEWTTAHGDIHWANLTQPECWLLDWESWGRAPLGFDAALLYGYSIMQPSIARQVYETFQKTLATPEGIRSQLFVCAELMRMTELYKDHPELYPHLERLSASLIQIAPR